MNYFTSCRVLIISLLFISAKAQSTDLQDSIPRGWRVSSNPDIYFGTDTTESHSGIASGILQRNDATTNMLGSMSQHIRADAYRGKRLMMSLYIKTLQVGGAGVYYRIDGKDTSITFSNLPQWNIQNTTDWLRYQIVLDVPEESVTINFGIMLMGTGTIWVDDVEFTGVDKSVTSDDTIFGKAKPKFAKRTYTINNQPINLDFEDYK